MSDDAAVSRSRRRRGAALATGMVAIGALLAACGPGNSSASGGSDSKTIVLGAYAPQTGPNSAVFPIAEATNAYFKWVDAHGGINGYRFKYKILDDQYNPALTVSVVRKLVSEDHVLAVVGGVGTASTLAAKNYLESQNVPSVAPSTGATNAAGPYTFMMQPDGVNEAAFQLKAAASELAKGGKIALAYQNDDVGQPYLKGVEAQAAKLGLSVSKVSFQLSTTDFTPVAARLKASGADLVIVASTPQVFAPLVKAANAVGFAPKWLGVSYDASASVLQELPKSQTSNMYFTVWNAIPTSPAVSAMDSAMKKYYSNVPPSSLTVQGWIPGTIFGAAFKRMTDNGGKVSADRLVKALESLRDYSNPYIKGITYAPTKGVEEPHLPRPKEGIAQWQSASSTLKLVVGYQTVPKVAGEPGQ